MSMVTQNMKIGTVLKLGLIVAYANETTEEVVKWAANCWDFYYELDKICMFPAVFAKTRRARFLR